MSKEIIPIGRIAQMICHFRREKVLLDFDLATLYGVAAKVLNQAVKRNRERFPADFMFQLSEDETRLLRSRFAAVNRQVVEHETLATNWSQIVTSSGKRFYRSLQPTTA